MLERSQSVLVRLALGALSLVPVMVRAAPADPQAVAVNIERTPPQSWPGYGIYLGNGLVITAAHVVGHAFETQPKVVFAGRTLSAAPVKEGSYPDNDLTVLRIADPVPPELADRHTTVCSGAPKPDEPVVVATPEKLTTSAVVRPEALPAEMRTKFAAAIKDVYSTGNSGSGVFDADSRCLLGIMSSKLETHVRLIVNGEHVERTVGIAKHFVPAPDIQAFLVGLPPP